MKRLKLLFTFAFFIVLLAAFLQAIVIYTMTYFIFRVPVYTIITLLAQYFFCFCIFILIINREDNAGYKLMWCFLAFLLPVFFATLYFLCGHKNGKQAWTNKLVGCYSKDTSYDTLRSYIYNESGGCVRAAQGFEYYNSGKDFFEAVFYALKKSEKNIYIEFYSFERGAVLNELISILRARALSGVNIKILYDGYGCIGKFKRKEKRALRSCGIELKAYNKLGFSLKPCVRTHRKIVCIDGETAFIGGVNVEDSYVNITKPYGIWRDSGIKAEGKSAHDFEMMFLQLWNKNSRRAEYVSECSDQTFGADSIQPFWDSSFLASRVSKNVFLSLIYCAKRYIYISTPYLLLDNELLSALIFKAKSGIVIKIIVPHIPDKKLVFSVTRSFYYSLIDAGANIYEYTPGFNHAKVLISDGEAAYIGSCNLDHRALYFQHECGAVLYGQKTVEPLNADFDNTLSVCESITKQKAEATLIKRVFRSVLRFFSPLL